MVEVTNDELDVLQNFQKDKGPRPNGCTIEFFSGILELWENDLFHVIKYSRLNGRMVMDFNLTFVSLFLKSKNLVSFPYFITIFLWM